MRYELVLTNVYTSFSRITSIYKKTPRENALRSLMWLVEEERPRGSTNKRPLRPREPGACPKLSANCTVGNGVGRLPYPLVVGVERNIYHGE